jgi:hypothetical protein
MYHAVTREDAAPATDGQDEAAESDETRSEARKERVLHTRIPAVLEQELKAVAFALRMPVSNLVRTILEDAVAMADRATGHVESSLQRAAEQMHSEREKLKSRVRRLSPLSKVLAYQPVKIAAPTRCAGCNVELERGAAAALGVTERPGPKIFVCTHCMEEGAPPAS